jgi:membrane-associated protease RseP (regulator of RpoE activity)
MSFWFGVVLFAVGILVSVLLHEFGHLLTAKAFKMKATQYFAGFGPTLWSFRRGETEYGLKAIPAGGFVKIVGMTPLEDVPEEDRARAFYRQPAWQRFIVLVAGSLTHFVLALLILFIAVTAVGIPDQRAWVGEVLPCVTTDASRTECRPSDPVSPASQVGLKADDRVLAVDGQRTPTYTDFVLAIRAAGPGPVDLRVQRGEQRLTLQPELVAVTRPALEGEGTERVGAIGVFADRERTRTYGVVAGAGESIDLTGEMFVRTYEAIKDFPSRLAPLYEALTGAERDINTPISVYGAARLGGEAVQADQLVAGLYLLAGLNIFIGIFNLLPLLPLDGGHVAVLLFERARSAFARLFRRPDPGRVDITKLLPVTYVVVVLFGGLFVMTLLADIVNPIENPFQ